MSRSIPDAAQHLRPYLPRILIQWLNDQPGTIVRELDGSVVFVDISGFTKMSERLARHGKVGAEEVTDILGSVFAELLVVAYENGGSLVKFGGDALLLFFSEEGHAVRAARAAFGMRRQLRSTGRIETTAGMVRLRMSVGVNSGVFQFFLVGSSHRELMMTGPAATQAVLMENTAEAGDVLLSLSTALSLPQGVLGAQKGDGLLLRREPTYAGGIPGEPVSRGTAEELSACIPVAVRDHLTLDRQDPQHRQVTVGFIHFEGLDALISRQEIEVAAFALDLLVGTVQDAADRHGVTFLGTDVDLDGGKIILITGAPDARGDDEERMLMAMRAVVDADPPIAVRIGVNCGPVFVGDVGPPYRRTYTVMGDAVNLAARVMSKAEAGQILATESVIDASNVRFETEALEPFLVKGKKRPVCALRVGRIIGSRRADDLDQVPLVGRGEELEALLEVVGAASHGHGGLIEIVGEAGVGKTYLVQELRSRTPSVGWSVVACEPYEASTPYFPLRPLLRGVFGFEDDDDDRAAGAVFERLVRDRCPELLPWLPLLALPLDLEVDSTPQTDALDDRFRRERLEASMADLLEVVVQEPAAIWIDDAQWMDQASWGLIRAIAERGNGVPLVICVTHREEGEAEPDGSQAPDGKRTLGPLTPAASQELILAATEEAPLTPHAVEALAGRSGGNPRFLKSLVRALRESGGSLEEMPSSVEGLVMVRIDRLPPRDRTRLRYLSVLGMHFGRDLAEELLRDEGLEADDADWRRLAGLIDPDGDEGYRFRNGLFRDVAYESLPFRRRRQLHARAGDAIERHAGASADEFAELLSFHFLHSNEEGKAWRYARIAGEWAASLYANVEARDFYLRAMEAARRLPDLEPQQIVAVTEALGDVRMRLGEYREAETAYRTARRRLSEDRVSEARLLLKEALVSDEEGRYPKALRALSRGSRIVEDLVERDATAIRAQLEVLYGGIREAQGRYRDAVRWCQRAIEHAEAAGDEDALAHAYYVLDWAYVGLDRGEEAVYSTRALEIYERLGDLTKQADVMNNLGAFAYFDGDWTAARGWYERARDMYLQTGNRVLAGMVTANVGEILLNQGHEAEAEPMFAEALRVFRASDARALAAWVTGLLGTLAARTDRPDLAGTLLAEARRGYAEVGEPDGVAEVDVRAAESRVARGDGAAVVPELDPLIERLPAEAPMLQRVRAFALWQSGDGPGASRALVESLRASREQDSDLQIALTLDAIARIGFAPTDRVEAYDRERADLFERLGIVSVPRFPVTVSAGAGDRPTPPS